MSTASSRTCSGSASNGTARCVYQSERLDLYAEALERLKREGLVYPCFCTRAEIAAEIAASAGRRTGPDGAALSGHLPRACAASADAAAERPHAWRLDVAAAIDAGRAADWRDDDTEVAAEPGLFGDVVLARKDAPASYHLAVTVDDAAQGVTDVVRGRDLFACHPRPPAAPGAARPADAASITITACSTDADGQRLAKRHGAPTLADLRAARRRSGRAGRGACGAGNCRLDIRSPRLREAP